MENPLVSLFVFGKRRKRGDFLWNKNAVIFSQKTGHNADSVP